MIVCSCRRVSDRAVSASVAAGASNVPEVASLCGAGSRCGGCHAELERIIESHVSIRSGLDPSFAA